MSDTLVRAGVSLHGVLRDIEDLCHLDEPARQAIGQKKLIVRFDVPGLTPLNLRFFKGRCHAFSGSQGHRDIHLRFVSPQHFLDMMDGTKNPIPVRGLSKLSFMTKEFSVLADRLSHYLRYDPALAADEGYRSNSTILSAYAAFYGLAQVANLSELGQVISRQIEDGDVDIEVKGGPCLHMQFRKGHCTTRKGLSAKPKARMIFKDIDLAGQILMGERDSFAAIGGGELAIWGRVPMIDQINKLLGLLPAYLS
ncbi:MAG TPA: hypothetical protein GXZ74_00615 [Tissierellia bacterium]|nr:hypothetical protein [Tissierellia bacterium]